ncbi:WD40 repeat domain-containing protein [Coleofasciculus sp. E1-EBD-02]|uniref:WD40 repeat domain-containing protein n=1 Tax=Coleofasciculus sp. E1-EBD-02 TaxID=3068481 RepID=UPI0032FE25CF
MAFELPGIQALLAQAKPQNPPWLRPLTSSLMPPGTPLRRTLTGHSGVVNAVAVTPDGKRVVSGAEDYTLKVWKLETGRELFSLHGHTGIVKSVTVTPDGKQIISVSNDKMLKVWDLETRKIVASFKGDGALICCAVAPDGVTIVAGGASGRIHFLQLENSSGFSSECNG